jgi:hypothetical protein
MTAREYLQHEISAARCNFENATDPIEKNRWDARRIALEQAEEAIMQEASTGHVNPRAQLFVRDLETRKWTRRFDIKSLTEAEVAARQYGREMQKETGIESLCWYRIYLWNSNETREGYDDDSAYEKLVAMMKAGQ